MRSEISAASFRLARRLLNRKFRHTAGEFLVEGAQCVGEAVEWGYARRVLASDQAAQHHPDLVEGGYERLTADQVRQLADSVTPQGIFAVCRTPDARLKDVFTSSARLVVICAQIRDPGNLGTVIRCADAFGANGVILTPGSVDVTNPKTVRASVGSIFHLPVVSGTDLGVAVDAAHDRGFTVLGADGAGQDMTAVLSKLGPGAKVAWIMGNEAWGLPDDELGLADRVVRIPMWGRAESLNLSTAAAVCLYATASRQHATTSSV